MFDANDIALHTISAVQAHYRDIAMQLYFLGSNDDPIAPLQDSPIRQRIELLVDVANGATYHEGIVGEALQSVQYTLLHIPAHKWHADLQAVLIRCEAFVRADELITITEACKLLRGEATDTNMRYVNYQIQSGKLTAVIDPAELNPQRNRRVWRGDVLKLRSDQ